MARHSLFQLLAILFRLRLLQLLLAYSNALQAVRFGLPPSLRLRACLGSKEVSIQNMRHLERQTLAAVPARMLCIELKHTCLPICNRRLMKALLSGYLRRLSGTGVGQCMAQHLRERNMPIGKRGLLCIAVGRIRTKFDHEQARILEVNRCCNCEK